MSESRTHRLYHRVSVVHGGTGLPFDRFRARLAHGSWPFWRLERRGAEVLLSTDVERAGAMPASSRVELIVAPELRRRFHDPPAGIEGYGEPLEHVDLARGADEHVVRPLAPAPAELVADVLTIQGKPRTGAAVVAQTAGDQAALAEDLDAQGKGTGSYRSGPRAWRPAPYRVVVDGQPRGAFQIDHLSDVTRLRVIDG